MNGTSRLSLSTIRKQVSINSLSVISMANFSTSFRPGCVSGTVILRFDLGKLEVPADFDYESAEKAFFVKKDALQRDNAFASGTGSEHLHFLTIKLYDNRLTL